MDKIEELIEFEKSSLDHSAFSLYDDIDKGKKDKETGDAPDAVNAAIETVLKYYRMKIPDYDKVSMPLSAYVNLTGLIPRKIKLEGDWYKDAVIPLIAYGKDNQEIALIPDYRGRYKFFSRGRWHIVTKQVAGNLGESGINLYKPIPTEGISVRGFIKFLFKSLRATDIIMVFFMCLVVEICGLILPYINSIIYNMVIPSGTDRVIPGVLVLLVGTAFFTGAILLTKQVLVARIGAKLTVSGQSSVWSHLFNLPTSFFKRYTSGEIYNRANAVNDICMTLGAVLAPAVLSALLSAVYFIQAMWFARPLLLPSILIMLAVIINISLNAYMQVRTMLKKERAKNKVIGLVYQLVGGIRKIRTTGSQVRIFRKWARAYRDVPLHDNYFVMYSGIIGKAIVLFGNAALYVMAMKEDIPPSDFVAYQTAFSAFIASIMLLGDLGRQFGRLLPGLRMIRPIISEKAETGADGEIVGKLDGNIEFNNVEFRYQEDMPYILHRLKFSIKAGEYVGIVGRSGCGKSTIMRLLLGFEKPDSGTVYYDGRDLSNFNLPSFRRRLGVILQNGKLFPGDVFINLAICSPGLTLEEAWDAAEKAGIADDLREMPMGMSTLVSDDGSALSGGQRQRIMIARAFASKPDIIFFDEATCALDNETQEVVAETVGRMDCTRVVIAHRLSTIKDCDRILYIDDGKVLESGTFTELMEKNGEFAKLARDVYNR